MALTVTTTVTEKGVTLVTYDNLDTADTGPTAIEMGTKLRQDSAQTTHGFIQAIGTFGSGTVKLQGSNDNSNWADLKDFYGTAIGLTATGGAEFMASCRYIRPLITGGSGDDVNVFITLQQ